MAACNSCTTVSSTYGSSGGLSSSNEKRSKSCRSTKRTPQKQQETKAGEDDDDDDDHYYNYSHTNSNSTSSSRRVSRASRTPYRVSFDNHGQWHTYHHGMLSNKSIEAAVEAGLGGGGVEPAVLPRYNSGGVWKVRLVINPEQLLKFYPMSPAQRLSSRVSGRWLGFAWTSHFIK